jgi:MFS family permease
MPHAEPGERRAPSVHFIFFLSLLNGVANAATQMSLSLYALKLGARPLAVGALAATFSILPMLLAVTAGRLVDRYGARWPMTAGALCSATGLLLPYLVPELPSLYAAGTLCGVSVIFFNLSTQNLVGLLSSERSRARNFTNYMLVTSVANLLAPMLAGFSIDRFDHPRTLLLLSLLMLSCVLVLLLAGASLPGGTRKARAGGGGGIRAMLADPTVRRLLITGSLVNAGINMYQVYMPVYAHSIGIAASTIGIIVAMNSAAAFVVRFGLPWLLQRYGEARILSMSFLVCALTLAGIPLLAQAPLLMLISFLFGLGSGCGQPIVIMMMFTSSQDGRSGEALGLKFMTNQLTKLAAPVCFGAIASALGLLPMYWINAGLMLFGSWISRAPPGRGERLAGPGS